MTDETPSSRRWLHQAVAGAGLRAALAVVGLAPAAAYVLAHRIPPLWLAQVAVGLFVYAFALFALERRGAPWYETVARLALAGPVGGALGWLAGVSLEHAGDPMGAWAELADELPRVRLLDVLGMGLVTLLVTQVIGAWFHVRSRTERAGPQVLCGVAVTGAPILLTFTAALVGGGRVPGDAVVGALATIACGLAIPLFVALGEGRWVQPRVDPQAPRAATGEARPAIAGGGLVVLGLLSVFGLFDPMVYRGRPSEAMAIGALKTIATSQTIFREGDKDGDGVLAYAASLAELSRAGLVDPVLGWGVKQGYVFRVLRSATTPEYLWIAAADPLPSGGDRSFVINHRGVIHYRRTDDGAPAALDAETCEVPAGWAQVGK
ncbi:MAG: hypothetical protein KF878_29645 [Planctomycetes bacterium]|nr:hypothetical protein [Planctomycetota bacterium]